MSVRSVDFTTLLKINREEFLTLLRGFPLDEEMFHMTKDCIIAGVSLGENGVYCYSCDSSSHELIGCPLV